MSPRPSTPFDRHLETAAPRTLSEFTIDGVDYVVEPAAEILPARDYRLLLWPETGQARVEREVPDA